MNTYADICIALSKTHVIYEADCSGHGPTIEVRPVHWGGDDNSPLTLHFTPQGDLSHVTVDSE